MDTTSPARSLPAIPASGLATIDDVGHGPGAGSGCSELAALVGDSPALQQVQRVLRKIAPLPLAVLIEGESGTGKELVARCLHQLSGRPGPFVALHCAGVGSEVLAAALFGSESEGRVQPGRIEAAAGGTLFLDEVSEMPAALQASLLRMLETGHYCRLGGSVELPAEVRLLSATRVRGADAILQRLLREDLYYRLAEFALALPPLRERGGDRQLLAERTLQQLNQAHGRQRRFSARALEQIGAASWPGNVRQLKHAVQRAFLLCDGEEIDECSPDPAGRGAVLTSYTIGMTLQELERQVLYRTLEHFNDDKVKAAKALGISLKTVYNRLASYRQAGPERSRADPATVAHLPEQESS